MARRESARMSLDATGAREISLTIPVAPDMEIVATAQAAAVGEFIEMPRDKIDEVKLALVEACINAFEHAHARTTGPSDVPGRTEGRGRRTEVPGGGSPGPGKGFDQRGRRAPDRQKTFRAPEAGMGPADHPEPDGRRRGSSRRGGTRILMRKYK